MSGAASETPDLVAFCRRMYPQLVGTLTLLCRDRGIAEDLAQETLIRVWNRWDEVCGKESPEGWTHRVAVNLATSWFRRRQAERRARGRLEAGHRLTSGETERADVLAVRDAVARLPRGQRLAVAMRYYAGLSVAETAVAMGCAEGTVKSHTARAVAALRRYLDESGERVPPTSHDPAGEVTRVR